MSIRLVKLAFFFAGCFNTEIARLLKVEAHCRRAERVGSRLLSAVNNPGYD